MSAGSEGAELAVSYLQVLHPDFDFELALLTNFSCALGRLGGPWCSLAGLATGVIAIFGGRLTSSETRGNMRATSFEAMRQTSLCTAVNISCVNLGYTSKISLCGVRKNSDLMSASNKSPGTS